MTDRAADLALLEAQAIIDLENRARTTKQVSIDQTQNDPFETLTIERINTFVQEWRETGRDPYSAMAAFIFGVLYENVTVEQRQAAKQRAHTLVFQYTYNKGEHDEQE